jgi:hypothetical protein
MRHNAEQTVQTRGVGLHPPPLSTAIETLASGWLPRCSGASSSAYLQIIYLTFGQLLELLNVSSAVYNPTLDVLQPCTRDH